MHHVCTSSAPQPGGAVSDRSECAAVRYRAGLPTACSTIPPPPQHRPLRSRAIFIQLFQTGGSPPPQHTGIFLRFRLRRQPRRRSAAARSVSHDVPDRSKRGASEHRPICAACTSARSSSRATGRRFYRMFQAFVQGRGVSRLPRAPERFPYLKRLRPPPVSSRDCSILRSLRIRWAREATTRNDWPPPRTRQPGTGRLHPAVFQAPGPTRDSEAAETGRAPPGVSSLAFFKVEGPQGPQFPSAPLPPAGQGPHCLSRRLRLCHRLRRARSAPRANSRKCSENHRWEQSPRPSRHHNPAAPAPQDMSPNHISPNNHLRRRRCNRPAPPPQYTPSYGSDSATGASLGPPPAGGAAPPYQPGKRIHPRIISQRPCRVEVRLLRRTSPVRWRRRWRVARGTGQCAGTQHVPGVWSAAAAGCNISQPQIPGVYVQQPQFASRWPQFRCRVRPTPQGDPQREGPFDS